MTTPIPSKIGKYEVTGVIGRGGMGVVYQATDPHLDRRVAIKMITGAFSENPDMLKRFFREAQSLGSLQHPNIVTVFDLGDYGGNPYFVMEYLEGEGLDSLLANRQLNLLEKISIMIQVCTGLAYAHRRGVIHRDIKPANIMISKDGGVKIFDFGIAHAGQTNVTRTGEVIGTLRYMAPEQINSKTVDSRTDIFSTGVVLYQLMTDHLPFDGDNTASTLMKIVSEAPPPLGNFLTTYPPEMEEILLKALAKNPNERYSTAEEFGMDLAQLQGQLKEEIIGQEMQQVALLIEQGEVYKAQSSLQRVLKIDRQHARANRLLREVQQRIQRDELGKQVRELRERAEQALADEQFDLAMEHVDRALGLDRDNFDVMQLREAIREAAARAENLHNALKAAEAAQAEGKLEAAKEAVEAALAVAPNDTQARTLYRLISRELEERARQQQVEGYLLEARQELSSRKFTAALVILKQAEELDPVSPQVHSLMESAIAGQEQERRRRELEALTREVEEALNLDDYRTACEKADEGLAKFPDDRNLLKLKGMADRQRLVEERSQFVDQLLAESRLLLQAGRNEELQTRLETTLSQIGAEPRLQSLLAVVVEKLQRERMERQRTQRLQQARQALSDQAYDDAIQTLEAQAREMGDDPEVQDLLARARLEQDEAVQGALVRAEQESVLDVRVNILEEALRQSPRDIRVKEQLHQARNLNQLISKIVVEAQKLEEDRQYDQALAKWETVSAVYQHYPDLKGILKRVRDLRDRARTGVKQNWIDRIEGALAACDYDQATSLVGPATEAFPWDSDLMGLQERAEAGAQQRAKAQKMLAEGRRAFTNQQWDAGAQLMLRAYQAASQDSLIRDQAVSELAQASRATINKDWQASELILRRLAEIEPGAAGAQDLQATIQERKREVAIASAMNAARRQQAVGDLQGALREIGEAVSSYPDERRLRDLQVQLEERVQQAREAARLAEIQQRKEAFVQDALKRARQAVVLDQRVQVLEEALRTDPQEVRLQQQLNAARELRQKQVREQEAREKEKRDQEQRVREREAKEREDRRRAEARAAEKTRPKPPTVAPAEPANVSATQIFIQKMTQPAPEPAAPASSPLPPPAARPDPPTASQSSLHSQGPIAPPDSLTTKIRQGLRDSTLFGKAKPVDDIHPPIEPGAGSDELQEATLPIVERHLAAFIGPLAKVLVKRAAGKTTSIQELYSILGSGLEREEDRKAFLAKRSELAGGKVAAPFSKLANPSVGPAVATPLDVASPAEITPAAIELGARRLAAHLGPIAPVLARKEAKRASNLREFYEFLAEHVVNQADRERFLKESGVSKDALHPTLLTRRNETASFNARPATTELTTGPFKPERKGE